MMSFIAYVLIFALLLSYPSYKNKERSGSVIKLLVIPVLLGAILVFLKMIRVYFVYKFLIILFIALTLLLSYWQWGGPMRRWRK
ncbi:hypothetical protein Desaci_3063 [Desulfosporosinus acidiphilus SJ4]|uniref:Uncharacterized protein n=1 Tax=Desulfosporosinus acidiphilus (strain DSM 22704 / JCM 16185 / SJ4) TaxID=646529 RepID=I4D846_DESAJ|nr:hypothetical protein [Desulfosporosinus acidiphilus]AFM41970.1 hypothetical protein Desaci_3063 [Desulfosporosinus acidiphilus SJ4]